MYFSRSHKSAPTTEVARIILKNGSHGVPVKKLKAMIGTTSGSLQRLIEPLVEKDLVYAKDVEHTNNFDDMVLFANEEQASADTP